MYLAGILALCALLHAPLPGGVGSGVSLFALTPTHSIRQEPARQEPAKPEASNEAQDQAKPAPPQQEPAPSQEGPQSPANPNPAPKQAQDKKQNGTQATQTPPAHKRARKKPKAPDAPAEEPHTVVRHGSTSEPATKLEPGMSDEQAARQRAATNQLIAKTDAALQRLSGRTLSKDQQDTVTQIRKFVEQVKTAQAAGDLQRAYKLAVKAHLLADALDKS